MKFCEVKIRQVKDEKAEKLEVNVLNCMKMINTSDKQVLDFNTLTTQHSISLFVTGYDDSVWHFLSDTDL